MLCTYAATRDALGVSGDYVALCYVVLLIRRDLRAYVGKAFEFNRLPFHLPFTALLLRS